MNLAVGNVFHRQKGRQDEKTASTTSSQTQAQQEALARPPAPEEIKAKLDEYVIGQEEAKRKKSLSVAVYNHYKRLHHGATSDEVELDKSNILLIGPTGTGKDAPRSNAREGVGCPFRYYGCYHFD